MDQRLSAIIELRARSQQFANGTLAFGIFRRLDLVFVMRVQHQMETDSCGDRIGEHDDRDIFL
jgi:hypothetical protein